MARAEDALALLAREPVDVVVTDLMMPGLSGKGLVERIEHAYPALRHRVVIMTGGAVTDDDDAFLSRADLHVVTKPVGRHELEAVLARVLGQRALRDGSP